jgi:hypothetical protein
MGTRTAGHRGPLGRKQRTTARRTTAAKEHPAETAIQPHPWHLPVLLRTYLSERDLRLFLSDFSAPRAT